MYFFNLALFLSLWCKHGLFPLLFFEKTQHHKTWRLTPVSPLQALGSNFPCFCLCDSAALPPSRPSLPADTFPPPLYFRSILVSHFLSVGFPPKVRWVADGVSLFSVNIRFLLSGFLKGVLGKFREERHHLWRVCFITPPCRPSGSAAALVGQLRVLAAQGPDWPTQQEGGGGGRGGARQRRAGRRSAVGRGLWRSGCWGRRGGRRSERNTHTSTYLNVSTCPLRLRP